MKKTLNFFSSKDSQDGFVGARIFESKIEFFFPLGMDFDSEKEVICKSKAFMVLSVLSTASSSNNTNNFSQDFLSQSGDAFNSFMWILNDFKRNGLFSLRSKTLTKGYNGKINWKHTFELMPYVERNEFVYLQPISEKNSSTNTIITAIHKYCLDLSIEKIGWIFSLENREPFKEVSNLEKNYYRNILLQELRKTFDDRRKLLLSHLLRIIDSSIGNEYFSDYSELGTYKFSRAWEYMIQKVYGNLPLDKFFPSATWNLLDREPFKSSNLRPDTVFVFNDTLYILDAKYYKFGVLCDGNNGLPNSDSIQKQITYGDHAALKFTGNFSNGIRNAFIVPFHATDGDFVKYAGYATAGWRETNSEKYKHHKIHLLLLDTEFLIKNYQKQINTPENTKYLVDKMQCFMV